MTLLNEIVGTKGAFETLRFLDVSRDTYYPKDQLQDHMESYGVTDPANVLRDIFAANLIHLDENQVSITTYGIRTYLLLLAINGGDIKDIYRRLSHLDSSLRSYELIREGMTTSFLQNLNQRPGFGRLYFCSPWIHLDRKRQELLESAVLNTERRRGNRPEVLVITRPDGDTIPDTLQPFRDLGATIYLNKQLHTKLYIREPDTSGGYAMAIVGSQNLTKSKYLELGIRINADGQMINKLISYFIELTFYSQET